MTEKQIQDKVIKKLESRGCFVIKTHPGLGTPTGTPDLLFFKGTIYGVIECKKSVKSPYRPLQVETLRKFHDWGAYSKVVYQENVDDIIEELEIIL